MLSDAWIGGSVRTATSMAALVTLVLLAAADGPADAVVLRDGRRLLGQVLEPAARGRLRVVVRREWLRQHLPDRAPRWERAEHALARQAREQRLTRLRAWKQDRQRSPDDRIGQWLDAEIARLSAPESAEPPLLIVDLPASEVRRVDRQPAATARILRQSWRAGLDGPEDRPLAELRSRLEGRGFALTDVDPARIDDLLALPLENNGTWAARRAATEVRDDRSLWLIQYQGLILPEGAAQDPGAIAANAGNLLRGLLQEDAGDDPLTRAFHDAEAKGRSGLVLTRLELAPDLSGATVEAQLWMRVAPQRWVTAAARPVRITTAETKNHEAEALAADPQVQAAFKILENLGLGAAAEDARRQSLAVGAATRQALGTAKAALAQDLDRLALPVGP